MVVTAPVVVVLGLEVVVEAVMVTVTVLFTYSVLGSKVVEV